jgi:uncharacterized protein
MRFVSKSLVVTVFALATMLFLLLSAIPEPPEPIPDSEQKTQLPSAIETSEPTVGPQSAIANEPPAAARYYFDVVDHSADDFKQLLRRAHMIYEQSPLDQREELEVVLVLHGPDIAYFKAENYEQHQEIVDLAAKLDAFGVFDFKICARSASKLGVLEDEIPAFIEFVPYGPLEISRLEEAGYMRL